MLDYLKINTKPYFVFSFRYPFIVFVMAFFSKCKLLTKKILRKNIDNGFFFIARCSLFPLRSLGFTIHFSQWMHAFSNCIELYFLMQKTHIWIVFIFSQKELCVLFLWCEFGVIGYSIFFFYWICIFLYFYASDFLPKNRKDRHETVFTI